MHWLRGGGGGGGGELEQALASDPALRNATRFFLKNGEHTWGICKDWIHSPKDNHSDAPTNAWRNADFARARGSSYSSHYARMETSWWEQRHWGITLVRVDTFSNMDDLAPHFPCSNQVTRD